MADNYYGNLARATLGQGLARGWGDEIEARIRTLSGPETYEEELSTINKEYNRFYNANKGAALSGEIIGSFLPTLGLAASTLFTGGASGPLALASAQRNASLLNKAKNYIVNNPKKSALGYFAGEGALAGAGRADIGERMAGAKEGVLPGIVGGGAGVAIGKGFNVAKDYFRNRRGSAIDEVTGELLDETITDAMADDQLLSALPPGLTKETFDNIKKVADEAKELDVPLKLLDTNVGLANQAKVITRLAQGDVPTIMGDAVARNANSAPAERVANQITKYLGDADFFEAEDAINASKKLAGPLYKQAKDFPAIINPALMNSLKDNPYMNEAFMKGTKVIRAEADIARISGAGDTASLIPNLNNPSDPISIEVIDEVKKALNAMSKETRLDGSLIANEKRVIGDLSREMVKLADNATIDPNTGKSVYANARQFFGDDAEIASALDKGRKTFNNVQPQELKAYLETLSYAAQDGYRTGAVQNMLEKIRGPSSNSNVAQKFIGSGTTKKNLETLFPEKATSNLLTRALELESQVFAYTSRLLRGSDTVENAIGVSKLAQASEDTLSFLQSGNYSSIVRLIMNSITGPNKLNTIVQEKMAKKLTEGPEGIATVVNLLQQRAPTVAKQLADQSMVVKRFGGDAAALLPSVDNRGDTSVDPIKEKLDEIDRRWANQQSYGGDGNTKLMMELPPEQQ